MATGMRWSQADIDAHRAKTKQAAPAPQVGSKPKRNKFGATRVQVDGQAFDSALEARYYTQLKMEWSSVRARRLLNGHAYEVGDVLWFTRQVPFELEGGVKYVADFQVIRHSGGALPTVEFIDTKGVLLQATINKLKQVKDRYGIDIKLLHDQDVLKVSL